MSMWGLCNRSECSYMANAIPAEGYFIIIIEQSKSMLIVRWQGSHLTFLDEDTGQKPRAWLKMNEQTYP